MTFSGFRNRVARLVADNAILFTASAGMAGFILTEIKQGQQDLKQGQQDLAKQVDQNLKQVEQNLVKQLVKGQQELGKRIDTLEERIMDSTAIRSLVARPWTTDMTYMVSGLEEPPLPLMLETNEAKYATATRPMQAVERNAVVMQLFEKDDVSHMCNGTLLRPDAVITARHCVEKLGGGERVRIASFGDSAAGLKEHRVQDVAKPNDGNDIAVLKLQKEFTDAPLVKIWRSDQAPMQATTFTSLLSNGVVTSLSNVLHYNGAGKSSASQIEGLVYQGPGRTGHSGCGIISPSGALAGVMSEAFGPASRDAVATKRSG